MDPAASPGSSVTVSVEAASFIQHGDLAFGSGFAIGRVSPGAPVGWPAGDANQRACRQAVRFARRETVRFALRQNGLNCLSELEPPKLSRAFSVVLLSRVYIGNLAPRVTEVQLTGLLVQFGPVSFVAQPHEQGGSNRGFAFANFLLPEAALLAIESLNRVSLHGQRLRVSRPSNQPGSVALLTELARECRDWDRRLYLANAPPDAAEPELRQRLAVHGRVVDLWLRRPPDGKPAFGFVTFADPAAADAALLAASPAIVDTVKAEDGPVPRLRLGRVVAPPDVAGGCLLPRFGCDDDGDDAREATAGGSSAPSVAQFSPAALSPASSTEQSYSIVSEVSASDVDEI